METYFWDQMTAAFETGALVRQELDKPFVRLVEASARSIENGGKILFFGNGGSAADAQHIAAELVGRYTKDRKPIPALALTTDTSVLTAIGNDLGFEYVFARQIEALGKRGDIAMAITTSGKSPNVIFGLDEAERMGLVTVALTGKSGGDIHNVDHLLAVPSNSTPRIQEMHITIGHAFCGALEQTLGLV